MTGTRARKCRMSVEIARRRTAAMESRAESTSPRATFWTLRGSPGRIPHDLRRTAVRNLERAGVPRSVAMKLTGHKTESVYRRYAIADERDLRVAVERLNAMVSAR